MAALWSGDSALLQTEAIDLYGKISRIPSIASGRMFPSENGQNLVVESSWKERNVQKGSMCHFSRTHFVDMKKDGEVSVQEAPFPHIQDQKNVLMKNASPSLRYLAVVSESSGEDKKQYLEIWQKGCQVCSYEISASKEHGKIICDEPFCSLQWSSKEDQILFIAETYKCKASSFFDGNKEEGQDAGKGKEFVYYQSWGERVAYCHPISAIFDISSKKSRKIEGISDTLSVGQALWAPNDDGIIFVGWDHSPRRLGILYCDNRRSAVYHLKFADSSLEMLSFPDRSSRSPRLNPSKDKIVFFDQLIGGPHKSCLRLILVDLKTKEKTVVIDIVEKANADEFPGLFVDFLAKQPWLACGNKIILNTQWRSNKEIITVDLNKKQVARVSPLSELMGGWSILDVNKNLVLCSFSSFSLPPQLYLLNFEGRDEKGPVAIELCSPSVTFEDRLTWECISFTPELVPHRDISFEAILLKPTTRHKDKFPLIALPHGGPHSCIPTDFYPSLACLCSLGFAVLCVNYRGSTGFGKASIDSLLGNIGSVEIRDVHQAVCQVAANGEIDLTKIFVTGGSHGGFIGGHLLGQYPGYYKAACLRNPVINLASMLGVTDIPDWCCAEAGLDYSFNKAMSADYAEKMIDASPIKHVDKVRDPCLLTLGAKDLRVPPSQGMEFYYALRARGVTTELFMYPDSCHSLSEVNVEADCFVHLVLWFFKHGF